MRTLFNAINGGDISSFDRIVSTGDSFKWYSVGSERVGEAAYDRTTLTSYAAARFAQGEHFELIQFRFAGFSEARRYANFNLVLVRSARDYPAARVIGKGAIACKLDSPQLAVFSLGPGRSCRSPCSSRRATASFATG